jgi:glycosyltransferase involved in cell wall biosynthesis
MTVPAQMRKPLLSVVVPCHNEELNVPLLHKRLSAALQDANIDWELILVDDHSRDATFATAKSLASTDSRVKALRLARNVGSHLAIICGIEHADGNAITVLAADLQDPPELIQQMLEQWRAGSQIVWAVRDARLGVNPLDRLSSRLFNRIMASILPAAEIDPAGVDFFLIDRVVGNALQEHRETNLSLFALLQSMGFRQSKTYYTKQARVQGQSGWSLRKKLKLFVDSIVSFSFLPIRAMSLLGIIVATAGFLYALFVILNSFGGRVPSGWTTMIVLVLVLGGIQIVMLGVLGEYLWRNLAETRQRPRYLIEDRIGFEHNPHSDASVAPRRTASSA